MNRRKLAKMEVMEQGDVQVHPVGWPWIGHVAMELSDDKDCWIERPSDAVARLVEACLELKDANTCGSAELWDSVWRKWDAALAAVEKEGKHE